MEFLCLDPSSSQGVFNKFIQIPLAIMRGSGKRRFLYIPGDRPDRVVLVAHPDTIHDAYYDHGGDHGTRSIVTRNGVAYDTGGRLGADDRAGCAIVWLLKDFGHSLLITDGEERGCIGAKWLMGSNHGIADEINDTHHFAVEFDRRNSNDFKCYGVGSDEFRRYVQLNTGYSEPDRYSFTDICALCKRIPGVNLSVGYYDEHTPSECLVIKDWLRTLNIARRWLAANLPRFRLPRRTLGVDEPVKACSLS